MIPTGKYVTCSTAGESFKAFIPNRFFFEGVYSTAQKAFDTAATIRKQFEKDRRVIEKLEVSLPVVSRLHQSLERRPTTDIPRVAALLEVSAPTTRKAVESLKDAGILKEITGKKRDLVYVYDRYLRILNEGT